MALPKYQRLGVQVAQVPQVTTAGYQEMARSGQVSAEAMNRITNFALRQMETYAQIEGAEYGALNAPTQQQIDDAIASGADLADLVPGNKWSVFGRAAQQQGLGSISTAMELQARKQIVDLQAAFESNQIGLAEMETGLSALVSSQTDIMRRIDPVTATKFSASLGVTANSAYLAAAKQQAINDRADLEIQFRQGIDSLMRNAETIVAAGPSMSPDGTIVTIDQKLNTIRDQIASAAMELNDPVFYQTKMKEFDAAMEAAKVGVIMNEAMFNPEQALRVMRGKAQFADPQTQATFNELDAKGRRTLYDAIMTEASQKLSLEAALDAKNQRYRTERSNELQGQIAHAELMGDTITRDALMDALRVTDGSAYASKVKAIQTVGSKVDRPDTVQMLEAMSLNGTLTFEAVDSAFASGNIKQSTYSTFMADLEQQRNTAKSTALTWLKNARGFPAPTLINHTMTQKAAYKEVAEISNELTEALQRDPALDPMQFVQDRVRILEQSGSDAASVQKRQAAEQRLDEFNAIKPGITPSEVIELMEDPSFNYNDKRRQQTIEMMQILMQLGGQ